MRKTFILGLMLALVHPTMGQIVSGLVVDKTTLRPLVGVNVYWKNTSLGTTTDSMGQFRLDNIELPHYLLFSTVGYTPDSVLLQDSEHEINVQLRFSLNITEVEITEGRGVFEQSAANLLQTETINRGVLRKAACCNLSESFETSATVDVVLNDAVTGTRKIQMLGLEGIYVQKLFEGIPFNRGLGNILGFDQIPGPWIHSIQLTKGTGSVQSGYESLTGVINLNFLEPRSEEKLYIDVFGNNQQRFEANAVWNKNLSPKVATALFVNGHSQQLRMDRNKDGFLDMPLRKGFKLLNRWKFQSDFLRTQLMVGYTREDRTGGQSAFNYDSDFGSTQNYGFGIDYQNLEAMGKFGILSKQKQYQSLGTTFAMSRTDVEAYFGNTRYTGLQHSVQAQSMFASKFGQYSDHSYTVGAGFLFDQYQESYADSAFSRIERVPGLFAEYAYERPRFTSLVGLRMDAHNLYGTQIVPRLHLKYNIRPLSTLRATLGRGFRAPNALADQLGVLASSRRLHVLQNPTAETSWNTGISFLHKFQLFGRDAIFNTDYYYTTFENQWIVDRDENPQVLLLYNLQAKSTAHSFQTDFQAEFAKGLAAKFSYKLQQVEVGYLSGRREKPFVSKHRALFNIGYTSPNGQWYLDLTTNWYGSQRLPDTSQNPEKYQLSSGSKDYFLINSQVTRVFNIFEVYVGTENLGNFIQDNAIINPENPFETNFDATLIYGPLNGRTFYLGARFNLKTDKS